jgi:hypothetical protein
MNPVQKALTIAMSLALLTLGIMFSVVAIPLIAVSGALALGYVYWKTRALRKALAQAMQTGHMKQSEVIEGEAVVIREPHEANRFLN